MCNVLRGAWFSAILCGATCPATIAMGQMSTSAAYDLAGRVGVSPSYTPPSPSYPARQDTFDVVSTDVKTDGSGALAFTIAHRSVGDDDAFATADVTAYADAEIGGLHLELRGRFEETFSLAHPTGYAELAGASVWAKWTDTSVINSPDVPPGEIVIFESHLGVTSEGVNILVLGSNSINPTRNYAACEVHLVLESDGPIADNLPPPPIDGLYWAKFSDSTNPAAPHVDVPAPDIIPVKIFARNGVPFTWSVLAEIKSNGAAATNQQYFYGVDGRFLSDVVAEYKRTIAWGGETVLTNQAGAPITNWTITSESGFDYTRPYTVPEPSALLLGVLSFIPAIAHFLSRRLREPH